MGTKHSGYVLMISIPCGIIVCFFVFGCTLVHYNKSLIERMPKISYANLEPSTSTYNYRISDHSHFSLSFFYLQRSSPLPLIRCL